jgi:hypothetical protein
LRDVTLTLGASFLDTATRMMALILGSNGPAADEYQTTITGRKGIINKTLIISYHA